jgi:oligosaccharide repeat unit polymerase
MNNLAQSRYDLQKYILVIIIIFGLFTIYMLPFIGVPNYIIGYSILALSVTLAISSIKYFNDWANPLVFFSFPWLFLLGAYHFQFMHPSLQPGLDNMTYVMILLSVTLFTIGVIFGYKIRIDKTDNKKIMTWSVKMHFIILIMTFTLGLMLWMIFFFSAGGLDGFVNDPVNFHLSFFIPLLDDLYRSMYVSIVIGVMYLAIGSKYYRSFVKVLVLLAFMLILAPLSRADIFMVIVFSVVSFHSIEKIRLQKLILPLFILLLAFVVIQYHRGGQIESDYSRIVTGQIAAPESAPWIASLIRYTVPNIRNIQITMQETDDLEYGVNIFYPLWAFTRTANLVGLNKGNSAEETELRREIYGLGVFLPYMVEFYKDFGFYGVIIITFIIGIISGHLYYKVRYSPSLFLVAVYSVLAYCLLFSTIKNYFSDPAIWQFVIWFLMVDIVVSRKNIITKQKVL